MIFIRSKKYKRLWKNSVKTMSQRFTVPDVTWCVILEKHLRSIWSSIPLAHLMKCVQLILSLVNF